MVDRSDEELWFELDRVAPTCAGPAAGVIAPELLARAVREAEVLRALVTLRRHSAEAHGTADGTRVAADGVHQVATNLPGRDS